MKTSDIIIGGILWFSMVASIFKLCNNSYWFIDGLMGAAFYFLIWAFFLRNESSEQEKTIKHKTTEIERILEAKKRLLEAQTILCSITYPHPNLERARVHVERAINGVGKREARNLREAKTNERYRANKTKGLEPNRVNGN